jgi:hypothetical protein
MTTLANSSKSLSENLREGLGEDIALPKTPTYFGIDAKRESDGH